MSKINDSLITANHATNGGKGHCWNANPEICKSIIMSLPVGVVVFGPELEILGANAAATRIISVGDRVDTTLSEGTDGKVWRTWREDLLRAAQSGESLSFENVAYRCEGRAKLLKITCVGLSSAESEARGVLLIEDRTEKIETERQLAAAERLAAVGKLAAKVAHELNNPMDGILRYLSLATRIVEHENLTGPLEYLKQCRQGLMRMVQITSELLEFSRNAHATFEEVNIETLIDEAIKANEGRAASARVEIVRDFTGTKIKFRSGNLFQVFCNLIKNAIDMMPQGGRVTISTAKSSDEMVVIEFHDTGPGIATELIDVVFEPFFTTKPSGKGTGLGLAICKDIVEKYSGRITAANAASGGCIFSVYLPITNQFEKAQQA